MENQDYNEIEDILNYEFENQDLLQQAFVRRSYSKENGGGDNEVLEFIGDSVLYMVVTKILSDKYGYLASDDDDYDPNENCDEFFTDYQENKLSLIRKKIIQRDTLAKRIEALGLEEYLIVGNSDIHNHVKDNDSVKEDLFEAIIGAVAIDSNWNMQCLEDAVSGLLNIDHELFEDEAIDYYVEIQKWCEKKGYNLIFKYKPAGTYNYFLQLRLRGVNVYSKKKCDYQSHSYDLFINDNMYFQGLGNSRKEARDEAYESAYNYLKENHLLFTINDEIENPNYDLAINQLEILSRRGYFDLPEYTFIDDHTLDGKPIWFCTCKINGVSNIFTSAARSKKVCKKESAYKMLCYVLDIKEK